MKFNGNIFGYYLNKDNITFYIEDERCTEIIGNYDVYISGSFNGWMTSADAAWKLDKKNIKGKRCHLFEKNLNSVIVPGNSGFPEFNFFILTENGVRYLKPDFEWDNRFGFNSVIVLDDDEYKELKVIDKSKTGIKSFNYYDLNCPACRADFSNIRIVPGTKNLFRGYHPYKKSEPDFSGEEQRFALVEKTFELYSINSVVTLSSYELPSEFSNEVMPDYIKKIENERNLLALNLNYTLVYYHSDSAEFCNNLQKICRFILKHPGEYYVHSRQGSDSTGVVSAVIAALCGAKWAEICEDFERTDLAGFGNYRSKKLLRYSIKKMIGFDPEYAKDLSHLMQSYFIKEDILSADEISQLVTKLNVLPKRKERDYFNFEKNHICAKRSAKI